MESDETQSNALGLEFAQSPAHEEGSPFSEAVPPSPTTSTAETGRRREKDRPYHNPDRHKTGGEREKLTGEALVEKMARMREENRLAKERKLHVQKDEEAYRKTVEEERARQQHNRKIQAEVGAVRESNARLKMDKVGNREWDLIKRSEEDDGGGWPAGRRGGRNNRETRGLRRGRGGYSSRVNDRAYVPPEVEPATTANNNWGDTPIGGDVSQWLPKSSTSTIAAGTTTVGAEESSTPNWGDVPIDDISQWHPPNLSTAVAVAAATTDTEGSVVNWGGFVVDQDWGPPPTSASAQKKESAGSDEANRADLEIQAQNLGPGPAGTKGGSSSSDKTKNFFKPEAPTKKIDWANEPVPVAEQQELEDSTTSVTDPKGVSEGNTERDGGEEQQASDLPAEYSKDTEDANWALAGDASGLSFSADSNEPERDWAGNIIGGTQDWGPGPSAEELECLDTGVPTEGSAGGTAGMGTGGGRGWDAGRRGDYRGRGRGRGDGERGGRGRGGRGWGRGDNERGRGGGDGRERGRGDGNRGRGDGERGWGRRGRGSRGRGEAASSGEPS